MRKTHNNQFVYGNYSYIVSLFRVEPDGNELEDYGVVCYDGFRIVEVYSRHDTDLAGISLNADHHWRNINAITRSNIIEHIKTKLMPSLNHP